MECLIGTPLKETSTGQSHLKAMKPNSDDDDDDGDDDDDDDDDELFLWYG